MAYQYMIIFLSKLKCFFMAEGYLNFIEVNQLNDGNVEYPLLIIKLKSLILIGHMAE